MATSMPDRHQENDFRPLVGVPWRLVQEEVANKRSRIDKYLRAVEVAGGEPVLVSLLSSPQELKRQAAELDAFLLTGSPADVAPAHFHGRCRFRAGTN
jgi:gamma-glutamyl-gamma-aminobutyrate hydrolase PuuD